MQPDLAARLAALNARHRHRAAAADLGGVLGDPDLGRVALVSSFGAESAVLLHMVSVAAPETPVLFVDTAMLFPETLAYQTALAGRLGLHDVRVLRAGPQQTDAADAAGTLNRTDPDACCALRKTAPLHAALAGFDGWITGRKRYQGGARAALALFEAEPGTVRIKVNPLVHWDRGEIAAYMAAHALPPHPLVAQGYRSIGCAPCTTPAAAGEDDRAGRWRGTGKTECGLHPGGGGRREEAA